MEIQQQQNKPYIHLDEDNCVLTIKGASYPEHAGNFYGPIMEYINECLPKIKENKVTINLAMTLMNSVSEKCIFQIVKTLTEVNELVVNWYYESDDEGMEEEGDIWKSSLKNVKFNMHSIENIDTLQL
tara:strand:+ start:1807 stop:2190 length:384 start_codon:yes stop_codon:yes gene_type:complete